MTRKSQTEFTDRDWRFRWLESGKLYGIPTDAMAGWQYLGTFPTLKDAKARAHLASAPRPLPLRRPSGSRRAHKKARPGWDRGGSSW